MLYILPLILGIAQNAGEPMIGRGTTTTTTLCAALIRVGDDLITRCAKLLSTSSVVSRQYDTNIVGYS